MLEEHRQDLKGLLLEANPYAALPQFAGPEIKVEDPEREPAAPLVVCSHESVARNPDSTTSHPSPCPRAARENVIELACLQQVARGCAFQIAGSVRPLSASLARRIVAALRGAFATRARPITEEQIENQEARCLNTNETGCGSNTTTTASIGGDF
jgi:hypothetical protein